MSEAAPKPVFRVFVLTDIVGSTPLWNKFPETMAVAVGRHDEIVANEVLEHGGHLVRTKGEGDSTFSAYETPLAAARAAVAISRALMSEPWPVETPIRIRTGIHAGEATLRDGDYYGPSVNKAARLRAIANPDQVVASSVMAQMVDGKSEGVLCKNLGIVKPRDFEPEEIYQVYADDLQSKFPPLGGLLDTPNNLTEDSTSFVGREQVLKEIIGKIQASRLVSITGAGGSGKTRVLIETGRRLMDDFVDGVFLVQLAPVREPKDFPSAIATTLGLRERPGQDVMDTVCDWLGDKKVLLLLDNCEQLAIGASRDIERILAATTKSIIAASSQIPFAISAEAVVKMPVMAVPQGEMVGPEELLEFEGTSLFLDRAEQARAGFLPSREDAGLVANICSRVDGIPLAIELAAARVRSMSLREISDRLNDRFRLLGGSARSGLERHQTLRATIDWSHELLSVEERALFRRLAVFEGGFGLEAVETVMADPDTSGTSLEPAFDPWSAVDIVERLVDRSLVSRDEDRHGMSRFHMLESIRNYGTERLEDIEEAKTVHQRHASYYCRQACSASADFVATADSKWLSWFLQDHANLRAALSWNLNTLEGRDCALEAAVAMEPFWRHFGELSEGRRWLDRAVATVSDERSSIAARVLNAAGVLTWKQGDLGQAKSLFRRAIGLFDELGDNEGSAGAHSSLGLAYWQEGALAEAKENLVTARSLIEDNGSKRTLGNVLNNLGILAWEADELGEAQARLEEAMRVRKQIGDSLACAETMTNLGLVMKDSGAYEAALEVTQRALEVFQEKGSRTNASYALFNIATLHFRLRRYEEARVCNSGAMEMAESLSDTQGVAHCWLLAGNIELGDGHAAESIPHYAKALSLSAAEGYATIITEALEELPRAQMETGNAREAAFWLGAWASRTEVADVWVRSREHPLASAVQKETGEEAYRALVLEGSHANTFALAERLEPLAVPF